MPGMYINEDSPDVFYWDVKSRCLKENTSGQEVFLSIGIPTYRRAKFLEEAIDSALNQRDVTISYEVIVVNNDPEADMTHLLAKYKDVPNISFYVNERNIGMMGNWNRILDLSRGKWTAYLHDDDLLKENYIHEIAKILTDERYSDSGAFFLNRDFIGRYVLPEELRPKKFVLVKKAATLVYKVFRQIVYALIIFRYLYRKKMETITTYKSLRANYNIYSNPSCGCVFDREKLIADGGWYEDTYPLADWQTALRFNESQKIYVVRKKLGI